MAGRRSARLIVSIVVIVIVVIVVVTVAKAVAKAAVVIAVKRSPPGEIRNAPQGHHELDLLIYAL